MTFHLQQTFMKISLFGILSLFRAQVAAQMKADKLKKCVVSVDRKAKDPVKYPKIVDDFNECVSLQKQTLIDETSQNNKKDLIFNLRYETLDSLLESAEMLEHLSIGSDEDLDFHPNSISHLNSIVAEKKTFLKNVEALKSGSRTVS